MSAQDITVISAEAYCRGLASLVMSLRRDTAALLNAGIELKRIVVVIEDNVPTIGIIDAEDVPCE